MKNEDLDWEVYHLIDPSLGCSISSLKERTGSGDREIRDSLARLASAFLIEIRGETVHILSIQESLLRCQCRYDRSLPYTIENGVVKMKKQE